MKPPVSATPIPIGMAALIVALGAALAPGGDLERLLAERVGHETTVGIAAVLATPEATAFAAAGRRSAGGPPIDSATVFEIGSISKVFTTTLLAEMVERGEVRLDDPVRLYLPPEVTMPTRSGKEITLLDLATATSGLPTAPEGEPFDLEDPYARFDLDALHRYLSGHRLRRDPGSQYEYSNIGMGLLGNALARRAGVGYERLVTDRILRPLGMVETAITLSAPLAARFATGHGDDLEPTKNWTFPSLAGAGAWRSTTADMARFMAAVVDPPATPLGRALRAATEPRRPTGVPGLRIGLGWHVFERGNRKIVWHNGQTGGFHAFAGFDPATRRSAVVLSNSTAAIDDLGMHLVDSTLHLRPVPTPPAEPIAAATLDRYQGRYQFTPEIAIEVTRRGTRLFAQVTGQQRFRLFPVSATTFVVPSVAAEIAFEVGGNGVVSGLELRQNGQTTPARRLP